MPKSHVLRVLRAVALLAPVSLPAAAPAQTPPSAHPPCPARMPAQGSTCGPAPANFTCEYHVQANSDCRCEIAHPNARGRWQCWNSLPVPGPLPPPELYA